MTTHELAKQLLAGPDVKAILKYTNRSEFGYEINQTTPGYIENENGEREAAQLLEISPDSLHLMR